MTENNDVAIPETDAGVIMEAVIAKGDLSKLGPGERAEYYMRTCKSMGLNPLTQPFMYVTLNGKLTLYATRTATDQLRKINGVSLVSVQRDTTPEGVHIVTVRVRDAHGREDEEIGAVNIAGLKGDALANAYMKATTKAKRRATLSISGLGWLDESEIETIPADRIRRAPVSGYVPDDEAVIDVAEAEYVDSETGEIVEHDNTDPASPIPDYMARIKAATTEDELRAIAKEMLDGGIGTAALRTVWKNRLSQLLAKQQEAQPELVAVGADVERFAQQ